MNQSMTRPPYGNIIRFAGWGLGAAILIAPAIAMQMGAEGVVWTASDFLFAGAMILIVGVPLEIASRMTDRLGYKVACGMALLGLFLTVWINGAVGVIGDEDNPANLFYIGALVIGLMGAFVSGFRAKGMALAMYATAIAMLIVPVAAFIVYRPEGGLINIAAPLIFSGVMAALFGGAGTLFRNAAARKAERA